MEETPGAKKVPLVFNKGKGTDDVLDLTERSFKAFTKAHESIEAQIKKSPKYFIKTILPVLTAKNAGLKLAKSRGQGHPESVVEHNAKYWEKEIKKTLKKLYQGETSKPTAKGMRFVKI